MDAQWMAGMAFASLEHEVVRVAIPLAFARFVVPTVKVKVKVNASCDASESLWSRTVMAMAVGVAAWSNVMLLEKGRLDGYRLLLAVQLGSYLLPIIIDYFLPYHPDPPLHPPRQPAPHPIRAAMAAVCKCAVAVAVAVVVCDLAAGFIHDDPATALRCVRARVRVRVRACGCVWYGMVW